MCIVARRAEAVAAHEFRISEGIFAIARAPLDSQWMQRPAQGGGDLLGNLVFKIGQTLDVEVALPPETDSFQVGVKHFQGKTQLPLRFLDGAVNYEADPEA